MNMPNDEGHDARSSSCDEDRQQAQLLQPRPPPGGGGAGLDRRLARVAQRRRRGPPLPGEPRSAPPRRAAPARPRRPPARSNRPDRRRRPSRGPSETAGAAYDEGLSGRSCSLIRGGGARPTGESVGQCGRRARARRPGGTGPHERGEYVHWPSMPNPAAAPEDAAERLARNAVDCLPAGELAAKLGAARAGAARCGSSSGSTPRRLTSTSATPSCCEAAGVPGPRP